MGAGKWLVRVCSCLAGRANYQNHAAGEVLFGEAGQQLPNPRNIQPWGTNACLNPLPAAGEVRCGWRLEPAVPGVLQVGALVGEVGQGWLEQLGFFSPFSESILCGWTWEPGGLGKPGVFGSEALQVLSSAQKGLKQQFRGARE